MASQAMAGIGTKFYKWTSGSWSRIAEVNSINGPNMSREIIDVTSLDSENGYREIIGALRDGGTAALNMNFSRAGYDLMKADFEDNDRKTYKIVLPDTAETTFEFDGLVMELPLTIEVADKISMDVSIQISGTVDVYDGSSGGGS